MKEFSCVTSSMLQKKFSSENVSVLPESTKFNFAIELNKLGLNKRVYKR